MQNEDGEESVFKSKFYFNLKDATAEVKSEFKYGDVVDKTSSSAKLVGKTVFNAGLFAGKLGVKLVKNLPQIAAQVAQSQLNTNKDLSEDQRTKLKEIVEKGSKNKDN